MEVLEMFIVNWLCILKHYNALQFHKQWL